MEKKSTTTTRPTENYHRVRGRRTQRKTPSTRVTQDLPHNAVPAADHAAATLSATPGSRSNVALAVPEHWEVGQQAHLQATTFHQLRSGKERSWIGFWKSAAGRKVPQWCPCRRNLDEKEPHPIGTSPVGAHVLLRQGRRLCFAVVPCCKECNNTHNEHPVVWACTAVSVLNLEELSYAGVLALPSGEYWRSVDEIVQHDKQLQLTGLTNRGRTASHCYADPGGFVAALATLIRSPLRRQAGTQAASREFCPHVVTVNRNDRGEPVLPPRNGPAYAQDIGLQVLEPEPEIQPIADNSSTAEPEGSCSVA